MITRFIIVKVPEPKMAEAERTWKEVCGAKMINVKGCLSEQLLRGREVRGEYTARRAIWAYRAKKTRSPGESSRGAAARPSR